MAPAHHAPPRDRGLPQDPPKPALAAAALAALLLAAPAPPAHAQASSSELAAALSVDPLNVTMATLTTGDPTQAKVLTSLGVIVPEHGSDFAVLSTGVAGATKDGPDPPEPGKDVGTPGAADDRVELDLTIDVPAGANRMAFSFYYLTAEYPEHLLLPRDRFTVDLTEGGNTTTIATSDVSLTVVAYDQGLRDTGYDLFTDDASGTDSQFGDGHYQQPDASAAIARAVVVPVTGGTQIGLTFTIEDLGDGELDSTVVIDRLFFGFLEALDPNPDLLQSDGSIDEDEENLDDDLPNVPRPLGAAADGVTRVLLRTKVSGSGSVEFCLANGTAPSNGGLHLLGGSGRANCVTATVVSTAQGFFAFAVYQTPDEFDRGTDKATDGREVGFDTTFTPTMGLVRQSHLPFQLVRPPVIFVHGLWSSRRTWTFGMATDPTLVRRYSVYLADYETTNASYFHTNRYVVRDAVQAAVRPRRQDGYAVTQVDDGGHSMGGVLSRIHVQSGHGDRKDNFMAGDLHSLLTLDSPHTGSPLPDVVVTLRDAPITGPAFAAAMAAAGYPVDKGAFDDLKLCSPALSKIGETPIPGHALVGTGGGTNYTAAPDPLRSILTLIDQYGGSNAWLALGDNDFAVMRDSQEAGSGPGQIPPSAITLFNATQDGIHTETNGSSFYSARIEDLLNPATSGASFAQFPPVSDHCGAGSGSLPSPGASPPLPGGLVVTPSPPPYTPGAIVEIGIGGVGGLVRTWAVGPGTVAMDDVPPFSPALTIPDAAAGDYPIAVIAEDTNGDFFTGPTTHIDVDPGPPTAVTLHPRRLILAVGETAQLELFGDFVDDVVRALAHSSTGTAYGVFTNPQGASVVTVSDDGLVTALAEGTATIVAQNALIGDSVRVEVVAATLPPTADAGPDGAGETGQAIPLTGSGSTGGGGPGPILYDWYQTGGPVVSIANADQAVASFTPTVPGTYTFALVVDDGARRSVADTVTITVVGVVPALSPGGVLLMAIVLVVTALVLLREGRVRESVATR